VITDGSVVEEIVNTCMQDSTSGFPLEMAEEIEAWYASFEFYHTHLVQGDLGRATISEMFYKDLALNVSEW
jgi:hypothetical protein